MKQYLDLIRQVLDEGDVKDTRTGIKTISLPGAMMRFNLQKGFPAVTTKKLAFKTICGELCAFLRASRSASDFRELGCKVWDQNANENKAWLENPYRAGEDDLGPVYGVQWREWPAYKRVRLYSPEYEAALASEYTVVGIVSGGNCPGAPFNEAIVYKPIDQLGDCLKTIINNPDDRRILFHAWNPAELDAVALPACHLLYHFIPNSKTKELNMCLYVRSNDLGLGAPFNIAEAALLMHVVSHMTGYTPKWLTYFIGDAHIYENHLDMVKEQLLRHPKPLPELRINPNIPKHSDAQLFQSDWLKLIEPQDFELLNYVCHDKLTAPMAV